MCIFSADIKISLYMYVYIVTVLSIPLVDLLTAILCLLYTP